MVRVAIIGGGPHAAVIAQILSKTLKKTSIAVALYSLGSGYVVLHRLYTDKRNLEVANGTYSHMRKLVGKAQLFKKTRIHYLVSDASMAYTVKRVEKTIWEPRKVGLRVVEGSTGSSFPIKMSTLAYIEGEAYIASAPKLTVALLKSLKRVESLYSPRIGIATKEGKVVGIDVGGTSYNFDYVIVDEGYIWMSMLRDHVPKHLPRTRTGCIDGFTPLGASLVVSDSLSGLWLDGRFTICLEAAGSASGAVGLLGSIAGALGDSIERGDLHLIQGLRVRETILAPDKSPLVGSLEEGPSGLIAILGCYSDCLSLSSGIASTISAILAGEAQVKVKGGGLAAAYDIDRLERRDLLREVLGFPGLCGGGPPR
ncbi:MAG: hypothetical protein GSR80_000238 [Desulfurococcales archaeon]|nr:hypothetical protein [Desulfurococcales archaeon]